MSSGRVGQAFVLTCFLRPVTAGTGNWGCVFARPVTAGTGVNGLKGVLSIPLQLLFNCSSSNQFGFRSKHSTTHALLLLTIKYKDQLIMAPTLVESS